MGPGATIFLFKEKCALVTVFFFSTLIISPCDAADQTQGLMHARQVLYHCAT
jgi:hypothetical protein